MRGGGKRGGTELSCLLGGDEPCKLTRAGKRIRGRKSYGDIKEEKTNKKATEKVSD